MTRHTRPARIVPKRQRDHVRGRRRRAKGQSRWGANAVEFAIVANIMMIMVLACMEFARMNMVRNLAQDAAYFAARHAIVPGATSDEAVQQAEAVLNTMLSNGYTVQVSALDADSQEITVDVAVDFAQVALFAPYFLPNTQITTQAKMRTERYDHFYQQ